MGFFGLGGEELCVSKTVKDYTEECLHFGGNWELLKRNGVDVTTLLILKKTISKLLHGKKYKGL